MPQNARGLHRFLLRFALAGAHLFAWVFIFQYFAARGPMGTAFAGTAVAYAISQLIGIICTPFAALLLRSGTRFSATAAIICLAAAFVELALGYGGYFAEPGYAVLGFSVFIGLYRALYWLPYSGERPKSQRGEILIALAPALAGILLIAQHMQLFLLIGAALIALFAILPLSRMRHGQEHYDLSLRRAFHELFDAADRPILLRSLCEGFEAGALLLLWPLVLYVLFNGSFVLVGVVYSITLLLSLFIRGWPIAATASPVVRGTVAASAWVLRTTVAAPLSVVLVDVYAETGSHPGGRGIDRATLEQAADAQVYVDAHTPMREMAQGMGRVLFAIALASWALWLPLPVALLSIFGIAALAALAASLLASLQGRRVF